jgi:hypothetical protein
MGDHAKREERAWERRHYIWMTIAMAFVIPSSSQAMLGN